MNGHWEWKLDAENGKYLEFVSEYPYSIKFFPKTYSRDALPDALLLRQVHSSAIHRVENAKVWTINNRPKGDGWFVRVPNINVGIQVADCLPVAIVSTTGNGFFLLHCGWRSIRDGILENALTLANEAGISFKDLYVIVGPCIRGCHYEVGPEFKKIFPNYLEQRDKRLYLDLFTVVLNTFKEAGVPENQVVEPPYCTFEHKSLFWSYRRDGNSKKSMLMTAKMLPRPENT